MGMSQLPTVDDLLNIANGGQAKTFWEAWLDFSEQSLGGAAETTVTIAGGVIAVAQCLNALDTEGGAAADDLTNIDTTGIPNGSVIVVSCLRADHVPTVKHGVAGAGRILLADAADYPLSSTSKALMLRLRGSDWVEVTRAIAADLGTAAKKNTGTANGNVPLLGSQGLPVVSGELLTDIPRIGNFAPSQQPSPNMTLALAAGSILNGTALTKVAAQNTATITAPVANSRNDIVYIDASTGAVGVAAGAENASPVDPAVPAGKLPVARLRLSTTTTAIKSAIIDDIRPLAAPSAAIPATQGYLTKSGSNLVLQPQGGGLLWINGTNQAIPVGGSAPTLAPTGMTVGTNYYIYTYMNAGVMTLEGSTTGYTLNAATGIPQKTGDATRTLVGMARIVTGPAFVNTDTQPFVITWFNRSRRMAYRASGTISLTGTATEATGSRCEAICWGDDTPNFSANCQASNSGASTATANIYCDGVSTQNLAAGVSSGSGSLNFPVAMRTPKSGLPDGYHTCGLGGSATATSNLISPVTEIEFMG